MQQAFDTIAREYDISFTNTLIGTAQRNIVWEYFKKQIVLKEKLNVLELNCGTGEDALWIAKQGHFVLATDISEEMLSITKKKIRDAGLESRIQTLKLDISKIGNFFVKDKFDLVFSNFGGMNCISPDQIEKLPSEIKKLLNPHGQLMMTLMPTFCFWETFYFLVKLKFIKAFRRFSKSGVSVKINGSDLKTFYYSPSTIKNIFASDFKFISVKPVGLFIPPSYLEKYFNGNENKINFLIRLERIINQLGFFSGFSDHFMIHLQAK
jgi:ubiquinone/menaquinone biosynthesis C-methylase UbiE